MDGTGTDTGTGTAGAARRRGTRARAAAVVLALLAVLPGAAGCGAAADPAALSAPDVYYLRPYGDKKGVEDKAPLPVEVQHLYAATGAHRLTVEVERGAEKTVRLSEHNPDCAGDATRVACEVTGGSLNRTGNVRFTPVAARGSRVGDSGFVRFTYTTSDGTPLTARTEVVVGEPVPEVRTPGALRDVRPGSEVAGAFVVRNTGELPVRGLGLALSLDDSWSFAQRYANCRYPTAGGRTAVCRFPGLRIAPGQTAVVRPALRMRASRTKIYARYEQRVWPLDVGPGEYSAWLSGGDRGEGPALTADVRATGRGGTEGAGGDFAQGRVQVPVTLALGADYAVSDVTLHGAPGTERELRLVVRNGGPGDPGAAARMVFTPPPGARVTAQPMAEIDEDAYEPLCAYVGASYRCPVRSLEPGASDTLVFTLRLGGPGTGTVRVEDNAPGRLDPPGDRERTGRRDPDPADDEAVVTVAP
ncbi:hypothetical protein [Streptomyces sp. SAT1]|uniref:hypothetical protein n=1 Tax=Streptomyces sp. SAT1 TaxID=1849967 RepID=UPI000AE3F7F7|nr:hypothetical protein [Streptomyces sp. SAT1]